MPVSGFECAPAVHPTRLLSPDGGYYLEAESVFGIGLGLAESSCLNLSNADTGALPADGRGGQSGHGAESAVHRGLGAGVQSTKGSQGTASL